MNSFFFSWGSQEFEKARISESDITKACVYVFL